MRFWIGILTIMLVSCSGGADNSWTTFLPEETRWVVSVEEGQSLAEFSQESFISKMDDISELSLQSVSDLQRVLERPLMLKALAILPSTSTQNSALWILEVDEDMREWAPLFYEPLSQNTYQFRGYVIHRLLTPSGTLYAVQIRQNLLLSTYSVIVEKAIITLQASQPGLKTSKPIAAGEQWLALENLDTWVDQYLQIRYRPSMLDKSNGLTAVNLRASVDPSTRMMSLEGQVNVVDTAASSLVKALSYRNQSLELDRYIASNAAAFAIMHAPVRSLPDTGMASRSSMDSALVSNPELYRNLALATEEAFAVVSYAESGVASSGEFLFMRAVSSPRVVENLLESWSEQGWVRKVDQSYYLQSVLIRELLGASLAPFQDYYLSISGEVIVMATRRGLVESVEADRRRRRVIYYDDTYRQLLDNGWDQRSAIAWFSSKDFLQFLQPMLMPDAPIAPLVQGFDGAMLQMQRIPQSSKLRFSFKSFTREGQIQPYEELWVWPLDADSLIATPIAVNLVGNSTKEILATTTKGAVVGIAFDGTEVFRAQTEDDLPVGSPLVYDWYGNGQSIVMQAAGTKIYAWNTNGVLLPQFPLELGEEITTPLLVTDVMRNGIPELVVGTAARNVHVLDGRGQNDRGWPQKVNAPIRSHILHTQWEGEWMLIAHAENSVHAWNRNGEVKAGYPMFLPAPISSDPLIVKDEWRGVAADGQWYAIAQQPVWSDTLSLTLESSAIDEQTDSLQLRSVSVSSTPLLSLDRRSSVLLRDSSGFYRTEINAMVSGNGTLFIYDDQPAFIASYAMGQGASTESSLSMLDIDADRNLDIGISGSFGRLFAWTLVNGERLFELPTAAMRYPMFADLNEDGRQELIALTRDGLRCWTINQRVEE